MSQYGTRLAPPASERAHEAPVPDPAAAPPQREQVNALHGVMTGLANIVNEHLGRLTIGPQATRFLRHLERMTFGNAGWHRRAGRSDPGLWCPYDHAAWAETLGLSSSALTHLRTRLIAAEIIWYAPDPERRGHGALGWSFDFASWKPPSWGGARPGAGRPRAAPSVMRRQEEPPTRRAEHAAARRGAEETPPGAHTRGGHPRRAAASDPEDPMVITSTEPTNQDVSEGKMGQGRRDIMMSTSTIQDVNQTKSRRQRLQFKMSTARPDKPGPTQVPVAPVRKGSLKKEKKQTRRTDADASGVTSTPHVTPAPLFSQAPQAGSPEYPTILPRVPPPPLPAHRTRAAPTDDPLPPLLPYETLRSYWLRIYREACAQSGKEARHLVHAAARALLGMGHAHTDYVLLGQLHHAAGTWAAVLHWILDCAGREVADPRTYLCAIAARQRTKPPHRSQPRRQPGRSRPRTALTELTGQWADPVNDTPMTEGLSPPGTPHAPAGQIGPDACSSEGATAPECSPTGSPTFTELDQPCEMPAPDDREEGSDDTAIGNSAAQASSPDELNARANGVPDRTVVTPDVPMAHLWHIAQQRLRADLTPARYSSWLVNTELYRAPDGSLVLVTRTTFAAELIAQRWGERIGWVLGEITGRVVPLVVRMRRPGSAVPDG